MKLNSMVPLLVALAGSSAMADGAGPTGIMLGQPSYGGTGCPAGSASTTLSPDAQSLSILFDSYQVQAGGMSGNTIDRKSCNVAIPVTVPQGYSVSIIQIDYRGFNALPYGAMSRFNVEYFFAGSQGPSFSKDFYGSLNDDFLINNQLRAEAVVWSACGADVNLRANTNLMVQTNNRNEQAMATVDSADVQASVVFALQWKRCDGGYVPPTQPPLPPSYPPTQPTPPPYNPPVPPTYPPSYPPGPTYPPAPSNPGYYGDCAISMVRDYYNRTVYRVTDIYGRTLGDYNSLYDAQTAARIFDNRGQCSNNGGGYYPPRPTPGNGGGGYYPPRPTPGDGRTSFSCTLSSGYGQFIGTGFSPDAATADARMSCIHSGQSSFACNRAPVTCYRR